MKGRIYLLVSLIALSVLSCKDQHESYQEFIVPNGVSYPGKPLDFTLNTRYKQAVLSWKKNPDPLVTHAYVYWNNFADSLRVDYDSHQGSEITVDIGPIDDGLYSFTLIAKNKDGIRSIPSTVTGNIYGESYYEQLSNRPIAKKMYRPANHELFIDWGYGAVTLGAFATEVQYVDREGNVISEVRDFAKDGDVESSVYTEIDIQRDVKYRTLYIPDTLSLDTFKTEFTAIKEVMTYEIEIPKLNWKKHLLPGDWNTALAGLESWYGISYMWDGKRNTGNFYGTPHDGPIPVWTTVDMGENYVLSRFVLWHTDSYLYDNYSVKEFELWGSTSPDPDGSWGSSWVPLGDYKCVKPSGDTSEPPTQEEREEMKKGFQFVIEPTAFAPNPNVPIRYFRLVAKSNMWKNEGSHSIRIDEITFYGDKAGE